MPSKRSIRRAETLALTQEATALARLAIGDLEDTSESMRRYSQEYRELADRYQDLADKYFGLADKHTTTLTQLIAANRNVLHMLDLLDGHGGAEALGAEALQAFAELNTGWSVSSSIGDGRATKEFSRVLAQADMTPQRRIGGELHRDTYLALADYENSHTELAQIFEAWGFAGDFVNGEYFVVRISAPAGPITYGDLNKILRAEALLAEQGYTGHGHLSRFDTGVPEPVTAKDSQI